MKSTEREREVRALAEALAEERAVWRDALAARMSVPRGERNDSTGDWNSVTVAKAAVDADEALTLYQKRFPRPVGK